MLNRQDGMDPEPRHSGSLALIGEDEIVVMVEEAIAAVCSRQSAPAVANDVDRDVAADVLPAD
jgi:hypothetical protein